MSAVLLGACASIVEGTDQSNSIDSDPTAARCVLERQDIQLGVVEPTPDALLVEKSPADINVTCTKDGWGTGSGVLEATFEDMTWGNIIFGGIIGVGVDAATGASHSYPPSITVTLPEE